MKKLILILLCSRVLLCLVQVAGALQTEGIITTSPSQVNALKPGDVVSEVSGTIVLPTWDVETTFNPDHSVEFDTQLDNAKWATSIIINGVENSPRTSAGSHAIISGMDLAYPLSKYEVKVKFSMTGGVVPTTFKSGNIILIRARELDTQSNQVGSVVLQNGTVFSPSTLQTQPPVQVPTAGGVTLTVRVVTPDLNPIAGALVSYPTLGISGYTDSNGVVVFRGVKEGLATYSISKSGYESITGAHSINNMGPGGYIQMPLHPVSAQPTLIVTGPTTIPTLSPNETPSVSPESELIAQLQRQNELLAQQNKQLAEQSGLLSQIISMFQRFFGIFGFSQSSPSKETTPSATTIPSPETTVPETAVTYTLSSSTMAEKTGTFGTPVRQIGNNISVYYEGAGPGHDEWSSLASYIKININGIDQGAPSYKFPSVVGATYTFGGGTPRADHVIVTVVFSDGSSKIAVDTFV